MIAKARNPGPQTHIHTTEYVRSITDVERFPINLLLSVCFHTMLHFKDFANIKLNFVTSTCFGIHCCNFYE